VTMVMWECGWASWMVVVVKSEVVFVDDTRPFSII